ncbi:MAG TPA: hypothetical protein VIQ51_08310 [Chryseosolibacter sp.]|jgi:hypothetical protein
MKPVLCIILVFVSSCVSHDDPQANTCNVNNPIEDLPWLKKEVAEFNGSDLERAYWFITKATYKSETVFIVRNCCPNCSTLPPPVYACNGVLLFRGNDEQYNDISGERLIWKSPEYACTF